MPDRQLIEKKLQQITEYLDELQPIVLMQTADILKDYFKYHTAERLFQLIVDTTVDVNIHIIKAQNLVVPDDFQSTFVTLSAQEILPDAYAKKIAPTVGLRNRIVHRYESLQRAEFIKLLKENFDDFKQYLVLMEKYLNKA